MRRRFASRYHLVNFISSSTSQSDHKMRVPVYRQMDFNLLFLNKIKLLEIGIIHF